MPSKYYCVLAAPAAAILPEHARGKRKSTILIAPILNPISRGSTPGKMAAAAEQRTAQRAILYRTFYINTKRSLEDEPPGRQSGVGRSRSSLSAGCGRGVGMYGCGPAVPSYRPGAPAGRAASSLRWSLSCWSWSSPAARGCPECIRWATG